MMPTHDSKILLYVRNLLFPALQDTPPSLPLEADHFTLTICHILPPAKANPTGACLTPRVSCQVCPSYAPSPVLFVRMSTSSQVGYIFHLSNPKGP